MQQLRPAAKVYLTVVTVGALVALAAALSSVVRDQFTCLLCWRRSSCSRSTSSRA